MTIKCYFIGGPNDGKVLEIKEPLSPFRVLQRKERFPLPFHRGKIPEKEFVDFDSVLYKPKRFIVNNKEYIFYILEDSNLDVFETLLTKYFQAS